ncbi:sugar transferase [Flavobacterium sp.]|jgi:lipopolysaccharide/colanic/teichoic acid biosynthesis glycosyltransferase|uniref:sugar transferase n=1 Tax=Flavobacterium sp. TaxID=239 RepID=UPI0037C1792B
MLYRKYFKRIIDFLFSLIGIVLLFPIFIIVFILLFINNNGSPFFVQKRPGLNERIFKILKFKTMNDKKDENGNLLPDADRLTKLGSFIRKTSLDEIPQLINVLKGDMSLVGPRPLLPDYLSKYSNFQARRHEVKPGVTGWVQVNGRNGLEWDKKFELDVWYVDNISFTLDVKILFKTVQKVIKSDGINAADSATIEPFQGS